ncbi:VWA domain-containing protein [Halorussus sp. MSC15.2]|uniref:VWA domain-containing protein n=1 Tax=Halorussus sp. MSC15.2 TaxID=2283638 RepID=UPI0013D6A7AA|nr:VWA domain-containing protein [Halorussus sp. MSC15.2]NEU56341.1 VWA domain-containing protein [Halorussus sp. MSC15.2]
MNLPFDAPVEFARPVVLAAVPVAAVALWLLVRESSTATELTGDSDDRDGGRTDDVVGRRTHVALWSTRFVVVTCLVVAAAGPTTVSTATTAGDPQVTMLVDDSASMGVHSPVADDLEAGIEDEGVAVNRVTVATGNRSRVGSGIVANVRPNGSLLVVSDGQVTGGASLSRATDLARSVNATINRVRLTQNQSDARVSVSGPRKASVGVENRFGVTAAGLDGAPTDATVTVSADGSQVASRQVPEDGSFTVTHTFNDTGPHRITARLDSDDAYEVNDVYRKTVQVVEQPRVLYVSRGDYAFEGYLRELYNVTRAESVPADLDDYYAVVVHDVAAPDLGNVGALQEHVIDGGGLLVVGGEHAYEKGRYGNSRISSLLPVEVGGSTGPKSRVVLAVDVSGSAKSGMRVQKALALDVLSQLGNRNEAGIVAFERNAYRVADLASLKTDRETLQRKIRSLESGGGTRISAGLLGASKMLGENGGTVILLSDGRDSAKPTFAAAEKLADRDVRVVSVGVGSVNERVLRGVAERTGGSFLLADETDRLRVRFGGQNRRYSGDHAVVVDDGHFVTRGVSPTASLPGANQVSVKEGADLLVATGYGAPAVSAWRFGLGRVAAVTAYGADGSLGDLRSKPNSLLLSRSVNWAIGDPQRKATGVVAAPDTRVGESTTLVYAGENPPESADLSFSEVAPGRYEARSAPTRPGYREVLGSAYAVNYPAEYAALGASPELKRAVERTGGRTFSADSPAAIASAVERQSTRKRRVERSWDWAFLLAGLLVFVGEVCARRLRRRRGQEVIP